MLTMMSTMPMSARVPTNRPTGNPIRRENISRNFPSTEMNGIILKYG
jgi:hypothetical protein